MNYSYDDYLAEQIRIYTEPCEPKVIKIEKEYEGCDSEGNIEFSNNPIYNCEECDNLECEYYKDFN